MLVSIDALAYDAYMKRRLRSATVLFATGGALFLIAIVALFVLQFAGVSAGFDMLLSAAGIGALLLVLGGVMYAAGLSHKRTHRFLSERDRRTMQAHGREDRSELERETDWRV